MLAEKLDQANLREKLRAAGDAEELYSIITTAQTGN